MRRVSLGVVALAALGSLGACSASLEAGLSEEQANRVVVALDGQGIGATKEREEGQSDEPRFRVQVAPDDVARALGVLRAQGLPQAAEPGLQETFGQGGLVPTATEERARYTAALGGELARSIEAIDGVLDARVHIALPEPHDFALDEAPAHARASVLIRYRAGARPYDERTVKALVAGAVQGMQPEDVAVVGVAAPRAAPPGEAALVHVGPISVTRGTAPALKLVLGVAFALHIVLALALVGLALRRRRQPVTEPLPPG